MAEDKLQISWDDLKARRVDTRLREQDAMERNRAYAQLKEDALPVATAQKSTIWNNLIFLMTIFGLAGGLMAWGGWELVAGPLTPILGSMLNYDPGARVDSEKRLAEIREIETKRDTGLLDANQAKDTLAVAKEDGMRNPYFALAVDTSLTESQRKARRMDLEADDRSAAFKVNLLSYGVCGLFLAMSLALVEPVTQRKSRESWIAAGYGAGAGAAGGLAAAGLLAFIAPYTGALTQGQQNWVRELVEHSAAWGILGLLAGGGAGLVVGNSKKIGVGMAGGMLGGLIGGALFNPVQHLLSGPHFGPLIALVAIGLVAGLATGLLENVVKAGWLKVTQGVIAGKQFILYRNPTYIGSSPDCQIYLFKDPQVGKRHAALHLLATGIEIEDMPLGAATLVNGVPVKRAKLKNGDMIQIGITQFRFQEKRPTSGA